MRRVVLALGGTIAGLVMLLSFRTHMGSTAAAGVSGSSGTAGTPGTSAAGSGNSAGSAGGAAAAASAPVSAGSGTGTAVTGDVVMTGYGPTQVQITVSVTVLQHTDDGVNSQMIDGRALPLLNNETLTAQSAKINAVSGASYTSAGYIKSLQSALDKARA